MGTKRTRNIGRCFAYVAGQKIPIWEIRDPFLAWKTRVLVIYIILFYVWKGLNVVFYSCKLFGHCPLNGYIRMHKIHGQSIKHHRYLLSLKQTPLRSIFTPRMQKNKTECIPIRLIWWLFFLFRIHNKKRRQNGLAISD